MLTILSITTLSSPSFPQKPVVNLTPRSLGQTLPLGAGRDVWVALLPAVHQHMQCGLGHPELLGLRGSQVLRD